MIELYVAIERVSKWLFLLVVVGVAGWDAVPEVRSDLGRRERPEGEGSTLGRKDVEPAQSEKGEVVGWAERADEAETQRVGVEHDSLADQGLRDAT